MNDIKIQQLLDETVQKLRSVAEADTIIGKPIVIEEGVTIVPVSKISCGFASGGSDFSTGADKPPAFGGAGGGGVTVTPVAFVVVNKGNVRVINVNTTETPVDRAINALPDTIERIAAVFGKKDAED